MQSKGAEVATKVENDFDRGYADARGGHGCRPSSTEYLKGYEKGIEVERLRKKNASFFFGASVIERNS